MAIATDYTTDDLDCDCIRRQVGDGEVFAQGSATPPMAGGFLTRYGRVSNVTMAAAIDNAVCRAAATKGLIHAKELWLGQVFLCPDSAGIARELPLTASTQGELGSHELKENKSRRVSDARPQPV